MNHRTKPELIQKRIESLEAMASFGHLDRESYRDTQMELTRLRELLKPAQIEAPEC